MQKENRAPNLNRKHVVSQIKNSVMQKQQPTSKSGCHSNDKGQPTTINATVAASVIQRCWRRHAARRARLQSTAIRALLRQRQLLIYTIAQRQNGSSQLKAELDYLKHNLEDSFERSLCRERQRLTEIVQRGVQHLLHQQSDIIEREQQIHLYKQLTRQQVKQHEQLLQKLAEEEKQEQTLTEQIQMRLVELANLSRQLKQEHLEKSKLAYEKEYLLAENTRLKRLRTPNDN